MTPPLDPPHLTVGPRVVQDFDAAWKLEQGDAAGASGTSFDDSSWSTVGLPHTFNVQSGDTVVAVQVSNEHNPHRLCIRRPIVIASTSWRRWPVWPPASAAWRPVSRVLTWACAATGLEPTPRA